MQYTSEQFDQYASGSDNSSCLIVPCYSDKLGEDGLSAYASNIEQFSFKAEASETLFVPGSDGKEQTILWGLGEAEKQSNTSFSKSCGALTNALAQYRIANANIKLNDLTTIEASGAIQSLIKSTENKRYQFDKYKTKKAEPKTLSSMSFLVSADDLSSSKTAIDYAQAQALGVALAKNMGNEPGNVCTPSFLAEQAKTLGQDYGIDTEILDEPELKEMGMGAFVSVAKGSTESGKLIIMKYMGADKSEAPHVLVGKGITFDTGGISLKPGAQMDEMKYDMCGAASVLGTMKAVCELKPKLNLIGVIAAAENMPAGNASKPGDIVTTLSGQTVEILNTDAEGRLVLCDALTYVERFKPASVIDIATLTGACIIALGHSTSAVMGNNDELVENILAAGKETDDKAWQLPIWDEYQTQLDSPFADMQNIGGKGAGSITAACFLSRFTKEYPWAHMDIAGTAWVSGGKDKGATGRPVPLLLKYLHNQIAG